MARQPSDACTGKRSYETMADAQRIARFARRRDDKNHVMPYRCPYCDHWHIGEQAARAPFRRKKSQPDFDGDE